MSERAVSKVTLNGTTLIDVTQDTVAANNLLVGKTATGADGNKVSGAVDLYDGTVTPTQNKSGWVRPADWPNYDTIDISEEECMFFTYDSSIGGDLSFVGLYVECAGGYIVERGNIIDGAWVVEQTSNVVGNVFTDTLPADRNYTAYKVKPTDGKHITTISMHKGDGLIGGRSRTNDICGIQPCIERYGNLPYVTKYGKGWAYAYWGNRHLVSETLLTTESLTTTSSMYSGCAVLENVDINWNSHSITSTESMFSDCNVLPYVDLSGLDTSSVTTMRNMFRNCHSFTTLDVSGFDTSNVTDMRGVFYGCHAKKIDVSKWDTSNVTVMTEMFMNTTCAVIDVSKWNVSKVTNMQSMFQASHIKTLDVSRWNTESLESMSAMFRSAGSLVNIDISSWNTQKLTNMWYTFNGCYSLVYADIHGIDTSHVTDFNSTFYNCSHLRSIGDTTLDMSAASSTSSTFTSSYYLNGFTLKNVPSVGVNMFANMMFTDDFVFLGDTLPVLNNTNAFSGNRFSEGQRIRFKASLVDEAKTATNWSTYADYIEAIQE